MKKKKGGERRQQSSHQSWFFPHTHKTISHQSDFPGLKVGLFLQMNL